MTFFGIKSWNLTGWFLCFSGIFATSFYLRQTLIPRCSTGDKKVPSMLVSSAVKQKTGCQQFHVGKKKIIKTPTRVWQATRESHFWIVFNRWHCHGAFWVIYEDSRLWWFKQWCNVTRSGGALGEARITILVRNLFSSWLYRSNCVLVRFYRGSNSWETGASIVTEQLCPDRWTLTNFRLILYIYFGIESGE